MLFGHQNDTPDPAQVTNDNIATDSSTPDPSNNGSNPLTADSATKSSLPASPYSLEHNGSEITPEVPASPAVDLPSTSEAPASTTSAPLADIDSDNNGPADLVSNVPSNDDLLNLKQQALQQLSPLVGHLDQTPEEKFRTTMMMIQSSDNQSLIKDAYAAAQDISDDKARAQALLDIVNEINYFTQHPQQIS